MLEAAVAGAGLGGLFEAVLSVEEVGVFKPHPKVYQLAVDRLGLPGLRDRVPVVERLGRPRRLGVRHAGGLVQPNGQRRERLPGAPDREIRSLSELPALVGAA